MGTPPVFDRWIWLKRYLQPGPLRTLDAGCGSGAFTMYASKIGNTAVGLSFDDRNTQIARTRARMLEIGRVDFIQWDLRQLDQKRGELGTYDQIICLETIEHIINDQKLVRDLSTLLKPGGKLLLTTPYKHYRHLFGETRLSSTEDGGHVRWGYTHEEMRHLLKTHGLEVVREDYISGFISQQLTNLMRFLSRLNSNFGWLVVFPLRIVQLVDVPVTRWLHYPFLCIGVVAVKQTS